ncbi:DUF2314 domain-containing protein [Flavobacterium sp. RHBU_24]|uniref:DUF2314 domain-containing protein n=1 Tax=Flavobacterium sp. RHBU_24 TaxID=3391185 RepID=UPI00398550D1
MNKNDSTHLSAQRLAQENMPAFIEMFNKKKNRCKFNISAPYTENGHTETMWFTVKSVEGDAFNTELNNVPLHIKGIKLGDKIKIQKDSVKDWIVSKHHKVIAGNFANEDL